MHKSSRLVQALILSMALNVAVLTLFFYFFVQKKEIFFSFRPKRHFADSASMKIEEAFLTKLDRLEWEPLTALLNDKRAVQHGYLVRDFALSMLVLCYDLDVERAIKRGALPFRKWDYQGREFLLFPGLDDEAYRTIISFISQEKWPLTVKGLFKKIAAQTLERGDLELIRFFCHSKHFIFLETLFARTNTRLPIRKKELLTLALEGGWDLLDQLYHLMCREVDFSPLNRQHYLLNAVKNESKMAAFLLILIEKEFVLKELDDSQIECLIRLLPHEHPSINDFLNKIAVSPRAERTCQMAQQGVANGEVSQEIVGHFVEKPGMKELRPLFRQKAPISDSPSYQHQIQPGESLWLISKKYHVSIEALMEANHLKSSVIQPGKQLKIPGI